MEAEKLNAMLTTITDERKKWTGKLSEWEASGTGDCDGYDTLAGTKYYLAYAKAMETALTLVARNDGLSPETELLLEKLSHRDLQYLSYSDPVVRPVLTTVVQELFTRERKIPEDMLDAMFAYTGKPEKIVLQCPKVKRPKVSFSDICAKFGKKAKIRGNEYIAEVTAIPAAVESWIWENTPDFEVLEPRWLREKFTDRIMKSRYLNEYKALKLLTNFLPTIERLLEKEIEGNREENR